MPSVDSDRIYTAALVVIGDEILSGRTQDANIAYLAKWLGLQGIRLREVRVVADDHTAIGDAVNALRIAHDYLFTTGGIGPTHDDITVDAIAQALGVDVVFHPEAVAVLTDHYGDRINDARLRMARVPAGAELIANPRTKAPGIRVGKRLHHGRRPGDHPVDARSARRAADRRPPGALSNDRRVDGREPRRRIAGCGRESA